MEHIDAEVDFVYLIKVLGKDILDEAHKSWMTVHPRGTKIHKVLKRNFWWEGMKREVAIYIAQCLTF